MCPVENVIPFRSQTAQTQALLHVHSGPYLQHILLLSLMLKTSVSFSSLHCVHFKCFIILPSPIVLHNLSSSDKCYCHCFIQAFSISIMASLSSFLWFLPSNSPLLFNWTNVHGLMQELSTWCGYYSEQNRKYFLHLGDLHSNDRCQW